MFFATIMNKFNKSVILICLIEYFNIRGFFMNYLLDYFKGIAIGAGSILPGISSGVLCVVFGIYEKLLDTVLNFFKDFKSNFKFLFPIVLGAFSGIILFGNILKYLFNTFPFQTNFIFIGLILGSIPALFKEASSKCKFRLHYLLYTFIALFLGILMVILENKIVPMSSNNFNFIYLLFSGFAMSIGVIVPGVSSTIILMLFGVYSSYLSAVSSIYLPVLIPMAIGLFLGAIIWIKITKFLLNNFYAPTFYSIIGFTLGSLFVLWPGFSFDLTGLISIICFILGFFIAKQF